MNTTKVFSISLFCLLFTLSLHAQQTDPGFAAIDAINKCSCTEIIVNAGGLEKKYTHSWLEGIVYENGYIVFSKGNNRHMWNATQIVFIEQGAAFIRIHMNQSR
jgi:hypothetical protein